MAFGKGREQVALENVSKLHTGMGLFSLISINPDFEECKKLFGEDAKEPSYTSKNTDGVNSVRINLVMNLENLPRNNKESEEEHKNYKFISFFIADEINTNKDKSKVQVINEYGDTAWVTKEEYDAKQKPSYNQNFILPYRACFRGEETLINFIKSYLGIPSSRTFNKETSEWTNKKGKELEEAMASFSVAQIKDIIKGEFKELKELLNMKPNNQILILMGVRSTEKGDYQDFYLDEILYPNAQKFDKFIERVEKRLESGGYKNTYFNLENLKVAEYEEDGFSSTPKTKNPLSEIDGVEENNINPFSDDMPF